MCPALAMGGRPTPALRPSAGAQGSFVVRQCLSKLWSPMPDPELASSRPACKHQISEFAVLCDSKPCALRSSDEFPNDLGSWLRAGHEGPFQQTPGDQPPEASNLTGPCSGVIDLCVKRRDPLECHQQRLTVAISAQYPTGLPARRIA